MKIEWSRGAIGDLIVLRRYIGERNPAAARRIAAAIRETVSRLIDFPLSGRIGHVAGTRELIVTGTSYFVVYRVRRDEIDIVAVMHAMRQYP